MIERCSILVIVQNQEQALKENLSQLYRLSSALPAGILIVDNASIDDSYNYVSTHFPDINYRKLEKRQSPQDIINKLLAVSEASHLLIVDIESALYSICTKSLNTEIKNKEHYALIFPVTHRQKDNQRKTLYGLQLQEKGLPTCKFNYDKNETSTSINEVMLLDIQKLRQIGGLSTTYNSIIFALLDCQKKAKDLGFKSKRVDAQSHIERASDENTFFSCIFNTSNLYEDAWVYQFTHAKGFLLKIKTSLLVCQSLFSIKPQLLWSLFKTILFSSWQLPTIKQSRKVFMSVASYYKKPPQKIKQHYYLLSETPKKWEPCLKNDVPLSIKKTLKFIDFFQKGVLLIDKSDLNSTKRSILRFSAFFTFKSLYFIEKEFDLFQAIETEVWNETLKRKQKSYI